MDAEREGNKKGTADFENGNEFRRTLNESGFGVGWWFQWSLAAMCLARVV